MDIYTGIDELIAYAQNNLFLDELDVNYARNRLLAIMGLSTYRAGNPDEAKVEEMTTPDALLGEAIAALKAEKLTDDAGAEKLKRRIMTALSYRPSQVADLYAELGGKGVKKADEFLQAYIAASGFGKSDNAAFAEETDDEGLKITCKGTGEADKTDLYAAIEELIAYAVNTLMLDELDLNYARREIADILGLNSYEIVETESEKADGADRPDALIDGVINAAKVCGLISENASDEDVRKTQDMIMGALSLKPSEINDLFNSVSAKKAMDFLYDYSVKNHYIKKSALEKNIRFKSDYTKGGLEITINKARPEYESAQAAAKGNTPEGGYPKCSICAENEGFAETGKAALRTVRMELGGKEWFWQFSPYGYLGKHGNAVALDHTPMCVTRDTVVSLMDFVDRFPQMFIGVNAALAGVGGSVLAHNHFQGGEEMLPIHKAKSALRLSYPKYPLAEVDILDWYNAVIRVTSQSRQVITEIEEDIRKGWENYTDASKGIIAEDEKGRHNAVSLTMRKIGNGRYCLDIMLRSNVTSEEYPNGVFATHPENSVLKKEPNGFLEAQGYFILPGRIEQQMAKLNECLVEKKELPPELSEYGKIYKDIVKENGRDMTKVEASIYIKAAFGMTCERALRDISVFKTHEETAAFLKNHCHCK